MKLNSKMLEAIQLMVYTDMQKQEIAKKLNVAGNTISRWMDRDDFQEELRREMHRGFNALALKARKKLGELMDSKNDGVALGACKEVLNKAGYMETQKIEQKVDTNIITVSVVGGDEDATD